MIKHLTNGEPINDDIEICDETGDVIDYVDYADINFRAYNRYDLLKITKQIIMNKFICEVLIGSGKSNKEMVLYTPSIQVYVNITEEFLYQVE